jgi:PAS domain S-box-containing protein
MNIIRLIRLLNQPDYYGYALMILGVIVIIGWYTNTSLLVQIHPEFVPMQFNTALGFFLCGGALISLVNNKKITTRILSVLTLIIGVLTLCQYIFDINIGIDELFMDHSILTKTSHAGRMAPNTALCFSLSGLSILLWNTSKVRVKTKVFVFMAALVFSLGMVPILGYAGSIDTAYGWGNLTRMAIHTSVGFLIMSSGLILFAWTNSTVEKTDKEKYTIPDWLYLITFVISFTVTVSIWQALRISELNQQQENYEQLAEHIKRYIESNMDSQILALRRLADRWEYNNGTPQDVWEKDALAYYHDYEMHQAIEWVDANSLIQWVVPKQGNEGVIGMNVEFSDKRISAISQAREQDKTVISEFIKLKQGDAHGFLVYLPLYYDEKFDGYITAVYNLDKYFYTQLSEYYERGFKFYLEKGKHIYFTSHTDIETGSDKKRNINVSIENISWQLSIVPPPSSLSITPTIVLVIGLMLSLLLVFATWLISKVLADRKKIGEYTLKLHDYADSLQVAKLELQSILDNAVDAIITIDKKGTIVTINHACRQMFGYQDGELLGKNVKILMPSPYHEEHDGYLKNYNQTGEKKIIGSGREVIGLRKNGTTFPIELSVSENIIKDYSSYTGFIRDISYRKEADEKLTSQKEYYETLIHNLNVPAFILDTEHKVVIWNKACEQMTGLNADAVIGTSGHWRGFYNEERPLLSDIVLDQSYELIDKFYEIEIENSFIEGGRQIQNWCPMPIKGKPLYLAIDAGPIYDKQGKLVAIVQVLKDITKLKETQDELEHRQFALERSNEELQQFAYIASHDLQEPLRMVSSFTQLLKDRYKTKLDDQANEFIDFAVDGAKRMQSLIQDLLLLSRVDRKPVPFEQCDANEIYEKAILNLKVSIEETNSELSCDNLPTIYGDRIQLIQLFQNLIGNAVKYRDPDKKNKIHFSSEKQNEFWRFYVKDNGIGIAPEYFDNIFVIFKRLHTKHEYSGTGIGLALCKKIVERHGGEIGLESSLGEGTTFFFTLPLEKQIIDDNM